MSDDALERLDQGLGGKLGSLSTVVTELVELLGRDEVNLGEVERWLAKDQGLATGVLRIANSPFYGMARRIGSLREATVILGVHTVRNVVTTAGVLELFGEESEIGFDRLAFWQHSNCAAVAAQVVAAECGQEPDEAYTAGLLHDVGRLVIDTVLPQEFARVISLCRERGCQMGEAEREVLGFDHAFAGARAVERWHLPVEVLEAVRDHHAPLAADGPTLTDFVHVGNVLCRALDIGNSREDKVPPPDAGAWERVGLDAEKLKHCLARIEQLNASATLVAP